jgi:putative ABC transport system permease protein
MLKSHVKLALKVLGRRPFFTAVSLLGVTLTLLVLTVVASLFDHAFAPQAPEVRQDRTLLVLSLELRGDRATSTGQPGYLLLDRYARGLPGVERMSISTQIQSAFSYVGGDRVRSYLKRTDGEFWRIMAFDFLEGGPYTDEDVASARPVAVINATTRDRFFGGGPAAGKSFEMDGQRYQVVGVVSDVPFLRLVPFADVFVPLTVARSDAWRRDLRGPFMGVLLARSRADFPAIQSEFRSRMAAVDLSGTEFKTARAEAETLFATVARMLVRTGPGRAVVGGGSGPGGYVAKFVVVLSALALAFMALPALNLVNLSVSRALERASEIGVRRAFGATRAALVGQFVLENLVLTLIGGGVALVATEAALRALTASGLIPYADFHVSGRVFGWGLFFALAFGVLSGAWPAWRLSRLHPVDALRGGTR